MGKRFSRSIVIIIALFLLAINCNAEENYWNGGHVWDATYFLGGGLIGTMSYNYFENSFIESIAIAGALSFIKEIGDELYKFEVINHNKLLNSFFDKRGYDIKDVLLCTSGAIICTLPYLHKKYRFYLTKNRCIAIISL